MATSPPRSGREPGPVGNAGVGVRREEEREPAGEEIRLGAAALIGTVLLRHGNQPLDARDGSVLRSPGLEIILAGAERDFPREGRVRPEDRTEDPVERRDQLRLRPAADAEEPPLASSGLHGAGQLLEDFHVGAAEVVDGLLPVAHRAEKAGLEREPSRAVRAQGPRRPVPCLGEQEGELQLEDVGVLELVEEERPDAGLLARPEARIRRAGGRERG